MRALFTELQWYRTHNGDLHSAFPTLPIKEWEQARDDEWEQFADLVDTLGEPLEGLPNLGPPLIPKNGALQPAEPRRRRLRSFAEHQPSYLPDDDIRAVWASLADRIDPGLTPEQRARVKESLSQYRMTPTLKELGQAAGVEHAIDLIDNKMQDIKAYRHAYTDLELKFLNLTVKDLLAKGVLGKASHVLPRL